MAKLNLFPLGIVAYPTKKIPLHIFEERYKTLIAECIKNQTEFGIIYEDANGLAKIGCTVSVKELINQYHDGRMDILCVGKKIFKMKGKTLVNQITVGDINYLPEPLLLPKSSFDPLKDKYLKIIITLGGAKDLKRHMFKKTTFELLEMIRFPPKIEQELISLSSEEKRAQILNKFFQSVLEETSNFNNNEKFLS